MARAARPISAAEFIEEKLRTVHTHSHGQELFARFLVDAMDPASDSRQLSEESINNIFSGKMKRPEMRSLVEEIGAKGETGRLCWSLGKIDEMARKGKSGLDAEEQTNATKLTAYCRFYLQDHSYFLQQAIENKTEKKATGGMAMKVFGSGAIPRTEGDPDRPKLPAEAEVDAVMEYAKNEVILANLEKMLSRLRLADLERRLAELRSGRGGSGPSGGAAAASASPFTGGRGTGGRE